MSGRTGTQLYFLLPRLAKLIALILLGTAVLVFLFCGLAVALGAAVNWLIPALSLETATLLSALALVSLSPVATALLVGVMIISKTEQVDEEDYVYREDWGTNEEFEAGTDDRDDDDHDDRHDDNNKQRRQFDSAHVFAIGDDLIGKFEPYQPAKSRQSTKRRRRQKSRNG